MSRTGTELFITIKIETAEISETHNKKRKFGEFNTHREEDISEPWKAEEKKRSYLLEKFVQMAGGLSTKNKQKKTTDNLTCMS